MKTKSTPFLFFFLLLIVVPLGYSTQLADSSMLPKYLLVCISLIGSLALLLRKKPSIIRSVSIIDFFVLLYLTACSTSILFALNKSEAIYETLKVLLFVITFFTSKLLLQKADLQEKTSIILSLLVSISTFLAFAFCLQDITQALKINAPLSSTVYLIKGLHGHKNLLSAWFLLLLSFSLLGIPNKNKTSRVLCFSAIFIQLSMILFLQTRAAYVALLVGGVFGLLFWFMRSKLSFSSLQIISFSVVGILVFSTSMILFTNKPEAYLLSFETNSTSVQERVILWGKTIQLIKSDGLMGLGGGNWKINFPDMTLDGLYRAKQNNVVFLRPHNDLLWVWVEHGLLGFISFISIFFSTLYYGIKSVIVNQENKQKIVIACAGIVAYLSFSFFDFPKERMEHLIGIALLLAFVSHFSKAQQLIFKVKLSTSFIIIISAILCGLSLTYGILRFNAEKTAFKVVNLKANGNYQQMIKEAESIHPNILQIDQNAFPITWHKGVAYYNLKNYDQASLNFTKATLINPFNFDVLNNAGTGFFLQKNYAKAEQYYLEALRINSNFDEAKLNLIAVYINTGNWDRAKRYLSGLNEKSSRSEELRKIIENNQY